jgi:hypothetical protein
MNDKRKNTILFIICATIFNIILTLLIFFALFLLFFFVVKPIVTDNYAIFGLPVIFILAILLSFVIYRAILRAVFQRIDAEKHFDIFFSFKKPKTPAPPEKPTADRNTP